VRKLKIFSHVSLDGVMQHSTDENGFPFDGWTGAYRSPEGMTLSLALHGESFDLVLGRRTYDAWSTFWPKAPSSPFSDRLNAATKYVATHRKTGLEWGPYEVLAPDPIEGIRRLKSGEGRDLVISGSSTLTSAVLGAGLADEVALAIYPVFLGTGKRLFAEGTAAQALERISTQTTSTGITLNHYKVVGPLKTAKS
jgi:dihydrofolate reductase